jgi:LEA14-like dessication related protein
MRNILKIGALAALLLALGACLPRVQQPQVWLDGARLSSLGLRGAVVDVRLSVHNPNSFAVETRGLSYDLAVRELGSEQWVDFTEGRIDEPLRVGARDTVEVVVPVEFSYRGLGDAFRSLIDQGAFDYRVSGVVELQGPVRRNIPYRHTGRYEPNGQ